MDAMLQHDSAFDPSCATSFECTVWSVCAIFYVLFMCWSGYKRYCE